MALSVNALCFAPAIWGVCSSLVSAAVPLTPAAAFAVVGSWSSGKLSSRVAQDALGCRLR